MSDFKALFSLPVWRDYRKKQIEMISNEIEARLYKAINGEFDPQEINGMLLMAKKLLGLPKMLTNDDELWALIDRQTAEDMASMTMSLVRKRLIED